MDHSQLVAAFIHHIWNGRQFDKLNDFLHPDFHDHSLPHPLTPDKNGLRQWINITSASFDHTTIIETQVTENDVCIIRIRMHLKHTGSWRGIAPTGTELATTGYRQFHFRDGKIVAHRALVDGQTIETLLTGAAHGCRVPTP